jgi:hypothetical protein
MDSCLSKGYLFRRYIVHRDQLGSGQRPESTARERLTETTESGSERIPRSLLLGKRANGEHYFSLWIEDSPQSTAESFNYRQ